MVEDDVLDQIGTLNTLPPVISTPPPQNTLQQVVRVMTVAPEVFYNTEGQAPEEGERLLRMLTDSGIILSAGHRSGRAIPCHGGYSPPTPPLRGLYLTAPCGWSFVRRVCSDASYEVASRAFGAGGVRLATHMFNAMSPLRGREPGVVGAVWDSQHVRGGFLVIV
jgi:hypothetical protein